MSQKKTSKAYLHFSSSLASIKRRFSSFSATPALSSVTNETQSASTAAIMSFTRNEPKTIEAQQTHEYTIFILHGRGDWAAHFAPSLLVSPLTGGISSNNNSTTSTSNTSSNKQFIHLTTNTKLMFLDAGLRVHSSFLANQWFQISSLRDTNQKQDGQIPGLHDHAIFIHELIAAEIERGIPAERIVLMGLSQGGAMSLFALLTLTLPLPSLDEENTAVPTAGRLGAAVVMSGWLPFENVLNDALDHLESTESECKPSISTAEHGIAALQQLRNQTDLPLLPPGSTIQKTPIFIGHGTADFKVGPHLGERARDTLRRLGFAVEWKQYEGWGHWWKAPEELDDILAFLQREIGLSVDADESATQRTRSDIVNQLEGQQ